MGPRGRVLCGHCVATLPREVVVIGARHDSVIEEILKDPNYRILETGVIFTCIDMGGYVTTTWRRSDHTDSRTGYQRIRYNRVRLSAHRIIYRKFVGALDSELLINHKDGNKQNNRPDNLELITHGENIAHSYRVLGNPPVLGRKKIDYSIASTIRALSAKGVAHKNLALRFDLSRGTISDIVSGRTWKEAANA
jgi:hypothetical protein